MSGRDLDAKLELWAFAFFVAFLLVAGLILWSGGQPWQELGPATTAMP